MRISSLIAALALALTAGAAPAPAQAQDTRSPIADRLDGRLVQLRDGRLAAAQTPARARHIAFYFGASWCGPCRAFVPELREAYVDLRARGVEIVFVSDDAGCRPMQDYMTSSRMAWPALACPHRDRLAWLQRARGKALPGLLVYDTEGRLLASSWSSSGNSSPRRTLADLQRLAAR